eukprot:XP_001694131.1 predicted protein [Chlamydomonas reinhardtii]
MSALHATLSKCQCVRQQRSPAIEQQYRMQSGIDEAPAAKRADTRAVGAAGSGLRASFLLPSAGRRPSPSVAGADGGAAGRARSSLASGGPFAGGGGEPGGGAGAAGLGPDPAVGVGECDYGTILSAADVTALLADRDEAPVTFEAVLQQALWDASDQCAATGLSDGGAAGPLSGGSSPVGPHSSGVLTGLNGVDLASTASPYAPNGLAHGGPRPSSVVPGPCGAQANEYRLWLLEQVSGLMPAALSEDGGRMVLMLRMQQESFLARKVAHAARADEEEDEDEDEEQAGDGGGGSGSVSGSAAASAAGSMRRSLRSGSGRGTVRGPWA